MQPLPHPVPEQSSTAARSPSPLGDCSPLPALVSCLFLGVTSAGHAVKRQWGALRPLSGLFDSACFHVHPLGASEPPRGGSPLLCGQATLLAHRPLTGLGAVSTSGLCEQRCWESSRVISGGRSFSGVPQERNRGSLRAQPLAGRLGCSPRPWATRTASWLTRSLFRLLPPQAA